MEPSQEVKIEFIAEERSQLSSDELRSLARIIHRDSPKALNYSSDGARVILERLPPKTINAIYAFVKMKVARD